MTNFDDTLTRYLFGELSESERSRLEERYFTDAQTFEQLAQLETALVDSYARGQLSGELRDRFERAYLNNPNRRARVKFGEALTARLDQIPASPAAVPKPAGNASWWQRFTLTTTGGQRALAFSIVLALLLVSVVTVWLWIQNRGLQQNLSSIRTRQSEQEKRARETEQQLADERARTQQLSAELDQARTERNPQPGSPQSSPMIASLVLMVSGVRGTETGDAAKLVIHKETQQVRLQLKLKENEFKTYTVILQTVGGKEIYYRQNIEPASGASISFTLPASKVAAGDYILTLRGRTETGDFEDVSQSLFRVEKE